KTSMEKYLSGDRLPAIKRTKKGEKEIDMKPMVLQWSLEDPQVPMLRCLLRAGSTDNLKPTLLMAGIAANAGIEEGPPVPAREPEGLNADVIVHRVDTYMESNGSYVPMINCT
ncbi:MAG: DUF2344 domain-containing protein, partial [Butyrivibrio sp.]|nr:DUF2344 domain-containing protein [Butyrivibrio sp.]